MKFILFLFIIIGISLGGYAQNDFGNKSTAIPPLDTSIKTEKKKAPSNTPSTLFSSVNFPPISPPSNSFNTPQNSKSIGETSKINMAPNQEFKNPGDVYEAKFNKKDGEVSQVFRKNQYLGDFKTKSTFVKITCRDHEFVDGDEVSVYINDLLIKSYIILNGNFQEFEITLKNGFNKIDFLALSQGSSGPNTAEFQVYDDKGVLISANRWNLATGFKATVIIVKE